MKLVSLRVLSIALLCAGAASAAPPPEEPETVEGLVRVPAKRVDTLYAAPGVKLSNYQRLILDPVDIAFKADWQKRNPNINTDDVTVIRSQAGAAFRESFGFALSANDGYGLTTQPDADVLRVTTKISDLEVKKSPENAATARPTYIVTSDDLVLIMDLRDSRSGTLLARAIDRGTSRTAGDLTIADSVSNSSEARRALDMWAGLLRAALDEARNPPAQ
jgi:uncharacterized protein DUF3313